MAEFVVVVSSGTTIFVYQVDFKKGGARNDLNLLLILDRNILIMYNDHEIIY